MTAAPSFFHESLPEAWRLAATHILSSSDPGYVIVVSAGAAWGGTESQLRKLDRSAERGSFERPATVAEMLLPRIVAKSALPAEAALNRGLATFGRGRRRGLKFSVWVHTYFERITGLYYDRLGTRTEIKANRLLGVIRKLNEWGRNAKAAFYIHTDLSTDNPRPRGGPCLQYIQFRAYGDKRLSIVGVYRAHDYGNKALGNLIGLQRLGRFVASRTGRTYTGVAVVSLHPFGDRKQILKQFVTDVAED